MFQGVFGDKAGNSAGEYLSVDQQTGEVMVYVDADTIGGGYGFMKLSPGTTNPPPTPKPTTSTTAAPTTTTKATTTTAIPTTASSTTEGGNSGEEQCQDIWPKSACQQEFNDGMCEEDEVGENCLFTCGWCDDK